MTVPTSRRRRWTVAACLGIALGGVLGPVSLAPSASAGTAATCATTWGSLTKHAGPSGLADTHVSAVRSGRHDCYDRVVWDLSGGSPTVTVSYVSQVRSEGSGAVVPLRGGAFLHVVLQGAQPPTWGGSGRELATTAGYRTLRQVASAGAFEGYDTYGVGVRARLPFRVTVLPGPGAGSRLVLDVAHTW